VTFWSRPLLGKRDISQWQPLSPSPPLPLPVIALQVVLQILSTSSLTVRMESFPDATPIWDLSNPYTQLPDDDFMTMLQKQFPQPTEPLTFGGLSDVVNPQSIERYSLPSITPPSEDSSPSPPNSHHDSHDHDDDNSAPKRKASVDDLQEGPSQKSQHTCMWIFSSFCHLILIFL
jgi:hypothetical protein